GVEPLAVIDRPAPRLVALNQRDQHVELAGRLAAFGGAPARLDLRQRGTMVVVGADRSDVHRGLHQNCDTVSASTRGRGPSVLPPCPLTTRPRRPPAPCSHAPAGSSRSPCRPPPSARRTSPRPCRPCAPPRRGSRCSSRSRCSR